ncbi:hypothetical protein K503DRAFT_515316 [Rhizopogon vinicolor AM-OR11-026]|uniref:Uncharacterized protein n=1 Tax=Rhizopogon vinicolor AM-OR11-026 TaxID=1314800 RepID=A0A1B7MLV3_9AGAM|nr:hypothetical protein K503DRAFT_515316 [Rhizopogon vinicolor AM-OR11-026]
MAADVITLNVLQNFLSFRSTSAGLNFYLTLSLLNIGLNFYLPRLHCHALVSLFLLFLFLLLYFTLSRAPHSTESAPTMTLPPCYQ